MPHKDMQQDYYTNELTETVLARTGPPQIQVMWGPSVERDRRVNRVKKGTE